LFLPYPIRPKTTLKFPVRDTDQEAKMHKHLPHHLPAFLWKGNRHEQKNSVDLTVPVAITAAAQSAAAPSRRGSPIMGQLAEQYQGLPDDVKAQ